MQLPVCIHMGEEPDMSKLVPIFNDDISSFSRDKPYGGLWTSPLDIEHGTDWLRWCDSSIGGGSACFWHGNNAARRRQDKQHGAWQIHPSPDARVLYIEDLEDYEIVTELYPLKTTGWNCTTDSPIYNVDWFALSQDYDIVYVAKDAYRWVDSWDCETILFMRESAIEHWEIHTWAEKKRKEVCDFE